MSEGITQLKTWKLYFSFSIITFTLKTIYKSFGVGVPSFSFLSKERYNLAFSPRDLIPANGTWFLAFSFSRRPMKISSKFWPPIFGRFAGGGGDKGVSEVDLNTPSCERSKSDDRFSISLRATSTSTLSGSFLEAGTRFRTSIRQSSTLLWRSVLQCAVMNLSSSANIILYCSSFFGVFVLVEPEAWVWVTGTGSGSPLFSIDKRL